MEPAPGRALLRQTAEGPTMQQPHIEQTIDHAKVEPATSDKAGSVEKGTDIDKMPSLDGTDPGTKTDTSRERAPERDEHGRL
jgi:hypothetical protein